MSGQSIDDNDVAGASEDARMVRCLFPEEAADLPIECLRELLARDLTLRVHHVRRGSVLFYPVARTPAPEPPHAAEREAPEPEGYGEGWFKVSWRLLDSSRWFGEDSDTKVLMVFLAAKAQDPMNPNPGTVLIGDTGLSARTGVSLAGIKASIDRLCLPDPESRTKEHEGRTLERVPGGVRWLNFDLYFPGLREKRESARAVRQARARKGGLAKAERDRAAMAAHDEAERLRKHMNRRKNK